MKIGGVFGDGDLGEGDAVNGLRRAVECLCDGRYEAGQAEIIAIDRQQLIELKRGAKNRASDAVRTAGWKASPGQRRSGALALKLRYRIYNRDGWTCQWEHCRRRTVAESVFRLVSVLAPEEFGWNQNWRMDATHPMLWTHTAQLEHIVASSAGGSDEDGNLCTVCAACQYSKAHIPAEVLGWQRSKDECDTTWDGLTGYLPGLIAAVREVRPEQRIASTDLAAAALERHYRAR